MYKIKCPACKGTHTVKNGKRQGVQLYVCKECGYQFRNGNRVDTGTLWSLYQDGKQTMAALGDAQRGLLPAIPVHVPAAGMQGNAKYKQQDRRHVHRPEKKPQQP